MEKPNKLKGMTSGWEGKVGLGPWAVHPGPGREAPGGGTLRAWAQGRLSPRDKGSFGLKYWGVLPPAHHDAESERGIVCLDAGRCVHACVHGRHGPLMSQKRALQRTRGRVSGAECREGGWAGLAKGIRLGPLAWA